MKRLALTLDLVALLREERQSLQPDPVAIAALAEQCGISAVVCHLRNDRRHMQDRDVRLLRKMTSLPYILRISPTAEMLNIACEARPDLVVLVPEEDPSQLSDGTWDLEKQGEALAGFLRKLREKGIRSGLFAFPTLDQIKAGKKLGTDLLELYTGRYAECTGDEQRAEMEKLIESARLADKLRLPAACSYGLDYRNIASLAACPILEEFWVGHSILSRALFHGVDRAIGDMLAVIDKAATAKAPAAS